MTHLGNITIKNKRNMAKKKKYSEYGDKTQAFMTAVEKFLKAQYGDIKAHWEGQLELLATNYELFQQAKEEVKKTGLMITNRFGAMDKNPLLRVIVDSNIQCIKLSQQFGLTPSALGKIKDIEPEDADLIKNLLNG